MTPDKYPKFCKNCGAKLKAKGKFCTLCGNRIISEATPPKRDKFEEQYGYMPEGTKNLFRKALVYFNEKKIDKSLTTIDKAIQLNPDFHELWLFKGRAFGSLKKYKNAIECFDKALNIKPNDLDTMHVRAFSLRLAGKWKEALNYIDIILKVHPNSPKVLEFRTHLIKAPEIEKELLEETDDIDLLVNRAVYVNSTLMNNYLGIEYAEKALKISPDSVVAWSIKANAHLGTNEYDKSLLSFEKALQLKGDDFVLWGGKGFALLGKDKYEEAINCFDKALKLNPDEDIIQQARQKALIDLEQQKKKKGVPSMADLAGSMKTLVDQITEEVEDNYEGGSPYASLDSFQKFKSKTFFDHINSKEAKKSIEIPEEFKKIAGTIKSSRVKDLKVRKELLSKLKVQDFSDEISKFPKSKSNMINNAMTLLLRGTSNMYQGQLIEALRNFDEALKLSPNMFEAWAEKGNVLVEMNRLEEAIKCYDMAINLNLGHGGVYSLKGRALNRLNRLDEALTSLDMALALNPNLGLAWMNKGNAMQSRLDLTKRYLCYNRALEINPALPSAWFNKGQFLLDYEIDIPQAIECFEKTLKLSPNHQAALENRAAATGRMGKYEEALHLFDEVLAIYPNSLYTLVNKGNSLTRLKMYDEALKYHNRALEIDPNFKIAIDSKKQTLLEIRGIEHPEIRDYETNVDDLLQEGGSHAFKSFTKSFFKYMDLKDLVLKIEDGNQQGRLYKKLNEVFGRTEGASLQEKAEFLEEIGTKTPGVNLIWKLLEEIYTELDDLNNLDKVYERLIEIDPTNDLNWNRLGVNLCIQGKFQEGITKYQEALNLNPNNYKALKNLSMSYEILGNKEKAVEVLKSLLNMNSKDSEAHARLNNLNNNNSDLINRVNSLKKDFLKTLFQKEDS